MLRESQLSFQEADSIAAQLELGKRVSLKRHGNGPLLSKFYFQIYGYSGNPKCIKAGEIIEQMVASQWNHLKKKKIKVIINKGDT